jgi:hypothetical protein
LLDASEGESDSFDALPAGNVCDAAMPAPVAVDGPAWSSLVLLVPHLQACHSRASMLIVVVPVLFMFHRLPKFALLDSFYCYNRNAIFAL